MSRTLWFCGLGLVAVTMVAIGVDRAAAQCCGAPAVSYAPAYTTAYASTPIVYQTSRPGWYPGALLDRWRMNRWGATTTYATAYAPTYSTAYAPSYATAYTAAYTPTYSPSQWGVSYAAAYRPAYPVGYSVGYASTVVAAPAATCATCVEPQPVVMRPVVDACTTCAPACATCATSTYVTPAAYEVTDTGCVGCAPSATETFVPQSTPATLTPAAPATPNEPPPAIPADQPVEGQREAQKPGETSVLEPNPTDPAAPADKPEGATMFEPPALYDPSDRVTQRPNVPVWNAVYHSRSAAGQRSTQQVSSTPKVKPTAADVARDAQGWTSASK